jgi:hypothetical protein
MDFGDPPFLLQPDPNQSPPGDRKRPSKRVSEAVARGTRQSFLVLHPGETRKEALVRLWWRRNLVGAHTR